MNKIIVISGKQYCGKDTLAKILLQKMPDFKRIGIGDAIKLEFGKRNGLTFEEIESKKHLFRAGLIELGNEGRAQDSDFWLKNLANMNNIIVPDVRVEHEVDFFKSKGAFLVRVESSYENRSKRGVIVSADDDTETALDNYSNWNILVENNSDYEALVEEADKVIKLFSAFVGL
ncbi:MAG: hypothetical protein IJB79_07500 [Candidatus Gastranaerophilales bacterium]|nr:hypothetical protein [Candidatus Gastranaerophilales bacterium]